MPTKPITGWFKLDRALIAGGALAAVSGSAVKVYLALMYFADRSGHAWPAMTTLCQAAGVSRRVGFDAVAELEKAQLLTRSSGHSRMSTRYFLPTPTVQNSARSIDSTVQKSELMQCKNVHEASAEKCTPTRSIEPESKNKGSLVMEMKTNKRELFMPRSYRPESPEQKQMRETRWQQAKENRQLEHLSAIRSKQQSQMQLNALPAERLFELKTKALEKLPPMLRERLNKADPLQSPTLGALILGEMNLLPCDT